MKIGVICLANGPYSIFIDNLISSCEEKFLIGHDKEYFIITDKEFEYADNIKCNIILKDRNGWPLDCLLRPQYSYELKERISHLDYVYFFNANMSIYSAIGEEILPNESGMVGVEHPNYTHRNIDYFTYDRNPKTNAYIPYGEGSIYYQACFWGGTVDAFIEFNNTIKKWVDEDLNNSVEPVWLDESYLNKYFLLHPPKTLDPSYAWPTNLAAYSDINILQLQKKDYIADEQFRYI